MSQQIPGLYIAFSTEKGRGVFTANKIEKGNVIEICPVIAISKSDKDTIHNTYLHDYYFLWGPNMDQGAIALGYGSLYNHALNPNADFILDLGQQTIDIICIKNIEAGEEITLNYNGQPGDKTKLWFDAIQ